jgi:UDPglucose 6-dehydrogenase
MRPRDAELAKYAANAMLATRISFINEIARLCSALGDDIEQVRRGIGMDARIGMAYLNAGCGYGGSCFPKDVRALADMSRRAGLEAGILAAVQRVNQMQKRWAFDLLAARFGRSLRGRRIAVWGLAFKPGTNDLREAPAQALIGDILEAGGEVCAHDPVAMPRARNEWPQAWFERDRLRLVADPATATDGADALVLVTEWKVYRTADFASLRGRLRGLLVIDGRNQFDPQQLQHLGYEYCGVGRGLPRPARAAGSALPRAALLSAG